MLVATPSGPTMMWCDIHRLPFFHLCIEELVEVRVEQMGAADAGTFRGSAVVGIVIWMRPESGRRTAGVQTRLMATG